MLELAQAHASYRFIISDEETEQRRLLLWLFNPSLGISYSRSTADGRTPSPLGKSGDSESPNAGLRNETVSMRAAKIMYRVIGGDR